MGVSLKLAAFHPDRLVRAEMFYFGYRRLNVALADRAARNQSD